MAEILSAASIAGVATGVGALLVAAVGVRLLFVGYKFVKGALGRA